MNQIQYREDRTMTFMGKHQYNDVRQFLPTLRHELYSNENINNKGVIMGPTVWAGPPENAPPDYVNGAMWSTNANNQQNNALPKSEDFKNKLDNTESQLKQLQDNHEVEKQIFLEYKSKHLQAIQDIETLLDRNARLLNQLQISLNEMKINNCI